MIKIHRRYPHIAAYLVVFFIAKDYIFPTLGISRPLHHPACIDLTAEAPRTTESLGGVTPHTNWTSAANLRIMRSQTARLHGDQVMVPWLDSLFQQQHGAAPLAIPVIS